MTPRTRPVAVSASNRTSRSCARSSCHRRDAASISSHTWSGISGASTSARRRLARSTTSADASHDRRRPLARDCCRMATTLKLTVEFPPEMLSAPPPWDLPGVIGRWDQALIPGCGDACTGRMAESALIRSGDVGASAPDRYPIRPPDPPPKGSTQHDPHPDVSPCDVRRRFSPSGSEYQRTERSAPCAIAWS